MTSRKSKKEKNNEPEISILNEEENQKFLEFLKFQALYERLKTKDSTETILKKFHEEIFIPVSIFNERISIFETICRYLKENLHYSNKKISQLLNKSSKSIWQAYANSKKKHPEALDVTSSYTIPLSIAQSRKSVLGSIVLFLKDERHLSYRNIGLMLKRDERTIWTIYRRAIKKNDR